MKKLPIGIQTFSKIREPADNYAYIDKTDIALRLIESGSYYFLSRPRRFGKSLFCDTLAEMFKGNKKLFEGLAAHDKWNWDETFPVIRISFGSGIFLNESELISTIRYILGSIAEKYGIGYNSNDNYHISFLKLIKDLYEKCNRKVAIIIDEYDKPILDNITDNKMSLIARNILRNFYSAIKDCDQYIRFVFITGVSKFSKMNLFSGLNNLEDITINKDYATITGYTHNDLKCTFSEYLNNSIDLEKVRKWYNGYNYFGEPIYNPFDILLFLSNNCEFDNYWWETGNPGFLIEILKKGTYYLPDLEHVIVGKETLNCFDVDNIDLVALLWQTGYLTFDTKIDLGGKIHCFLIT